MATKKVELTENQILAILTAIQIHEDSYAGFPQDELREWGVNRELGRHSREGGRVSVPRSEREKKWKSTNLEKQPKSF